MGGRVMGKNSDLSFVDNEQMPIKTPKDRTPKSIQLYIILKYPNNGLDSNILQKQLHFRKKYIINFAEFWFMSIEQL